MSIGTTWLYLSSLFIVFLIVSGFLLKLFELPLEIISIFLQEWIYQSQFCWAVV